MQNAAGAGAAAYAGFWSQANAAHRIIHSEGRFRPPEVREESLHAIAWENACRIVPG